MYAVVCGLTDIAVHAGFVRLMICVTKINLAPATLLKSIACSSKSESRIWRSLVLPTYLTKKVRGIFYEIVGDSSHRPTLFGQRCSWLDMTIKSKATEELEAQKEVRAKVQKVAQSADVADDDMWEHIANAHLDTLDSEYSA